MSISNAQAIERWIYKGTEVATSQEVQVLDPDFQDSVSGRIRGTKQEGTEIKDPEMRKLVERSVN